MVWIAVLLACGGGTPAPPVRPTPPGLDEGLGRIVDAGWAAGVDVVVFDATAQGRVAAGDLAATPDGIVEYGSLTKLFVATAFADLVREGSLAEDAALGDVVPSLAGLTGEVPLALRDLATHRTRLPVWTDGGDAIPQGVPTARVREQLTGLHVDPVAPGDDVFHYANTHLVALAWAMEAASGASWGDLVRDRITRPLGIARVGVDTAEAPAAGRVPGHGRRGDVSPPQHDDGHGPARALVGTVPDLATFGQAALRAGTGAEVPVPALADTLGPRTPHAALGWWLDPEHPGVRYHSGITPGFTSWLGIDLDAGVGVALVASTHQPALAALGPAVLDAARGAPFEVPLPLPVAAPDDVLDGCVGAYGQGGAPMLTVQRAGDRIEARFGTNAPVRLFFADDGAFHTLVDVLTLRCAADEIAIGMGRGRPMPVPRIPDATP